MHKEVCIVYIPNLSEKKLSTIETIFYCFVWIIRTLIFSK